MVGTRLVVMINIVPTSIITLVAGIRHKRLCMHFKSIWMSWLYFNGDPPFGGFQTGLGLQNTLSKTAANGKWHQLTLDWKKDNAGGGAP